MTNLGFHRLMDERGIRVVTTAVGDRYVLEALRRENGILGGEQSGHVICLRDHVTGDGLAAALLLCDALGGRTLARGGGGDARSTRRRRRTSASPGARCRRRRCAEVERLNAELTAPAACSSAPSGTEPLIRVLGEAETEEKALQYCARIAALVRGSSASPRRSGRCAGLLRVLGRVSARRWTMGGVRCAESSDTSGRGSASSSCCRASSGSSTAATTRPGSRCVRTDGLDYVRAVGNLQNLKEAAGPNGSKSQARARPHALGDARRRHRGERAPADRLRRHEAVDRPERDRRELPRAREGR